MTNKTDLPQGEGPQDDKPRYDPEHYRTLTEEGVEGWNMWRED